MTIITDQTTWNSASGTEIQLGSNLSIDSNSFTRLSIPSGTTFFWK